MNSEGDKLGFGKPPKKNRFAPGRSGNPKGRPKGSKNVNTLLAKVGRQRVKVKGEQGSRSISKVEAAYTQLVNQAASGNLPAIKELFRIHSTHTEPLENAAPQSLMRECDEAVMKSIVQRIREGVDPDSATQGDAVPTDTSKEK